MLLLNNFFLKLDEGIKNEFGIIEVIYKSTKDFMI